MQKDDYIIITKDKFIGESGIIMKLTSDNSLYAFVYFPERTASAWIYKRNIIIDLQKNRDRKIDRILEWELVCIGHADGWDWIPELYEVCEVNEYEDEDGLTKAGFNLTTYSVKIKSTPFQINYPRCCFLKLEEYCEKKIDIIFI